jgi:ring-1,2-phenylacetyl-CoA epoxidase subunit PaaE
MAQHRAKRSTVAWLAENPLIISSRIDRDAVFFKIPGFSMSVFHPLRIDQLHRDTRDALMIGFAVPPELQAQFQFKQGQYLTLRAHIEGTEVRRAYSICSEEGGALRVGIKRVDGGAFSAFVHQQVKVGDVLDVMPPEGRFGHLSADLLPMAEDAPQAVTAHYLGIAAGSGITPILSMIKTQLLAQPHARFTLIYGNRATPAVMFKEELALLKDRFPTRLNLIHVMSREPQDMSIFHGRIDREKCDALFSKWLDVRHMVAAFICGPESMMQAAKDALLAQGLAAERIKTERFASKKFSHPSAAQPLTASEPQQCQVTLIMDGVTRHFSVKKDSQNLLDAGLAAGLDMRYSCRAGVCSTCRAKVTSGQVEMDVNYALEDYEVRRGFVLTCQSHCQSDAVTVNFDEEN